MCVCVAPGEGDLDEIWCMKEMRAHQLHVPAHSRKPPRLTHTHRHTKTSQVTIPECCKISVLSERVGVGLSGAGWVFSDRVTAVPHADPGPLEQYGRYYDDEVIRSDSGGSVSGICVCLAGTSQSRDTVNSTLPHIPPQSACLHFSCIHPGEGAPFLRRWAT